MKIAIDLLWVKHKKLGGLESYVMNLLEGFRTTIDDNSYHLIVSTENQEVFKCFIEDKRFSSNPRTENVDMPTIVHTK